RLCQTEISLELLGIGRAARLCPAVEPKLMRRRNIRGLRVQQAFMIRPKAQLDEGARIGRDLGLPAIGRLIAEHSVFGSTVPDSGGFSGKVMLANQCILDGYRPLLINAPLPARMGDGLAAVLRGVVGGGGVRRRLLRMLRFCLTAGSRRA